MASTGISVPSALSFIVSPTKMIQQIDTSIVIGILGTAVSLSNNSMPTDR